MTLTYSVPLQFLRLPRDTPRTGEPKLRGISYSKGSNHYRVQVCVGHMTHYIGCHNSLEGAFVMYLKAVKRTSEQAPYKLRKRTLENMLLNYRLLMEWKLGPQWEKLLTSGIRGRIWAVTEALRVLELEEQDT
jgi:hypothetical protein